MILEGVRKLAGQREMEEDTTEGSIMTPKVHNNNWQKTLEGVEEYLCTFCHVNGASLSYVARKQIVPTAEVDDTSNGYDTINKEMIERCMILVADIVSTTVTLEANIPFTESYLTDGTTVWVNLTDIFADSTAWT